MVPPTQKSPGFLPEPTVYGLCALREVGPGGNAGDFSKLQGGFCRHFWQVDSLLCGIISCMAGH